VTLCNEDGWKYQDVLTWVDVEGELSGALTAETNYFLDCVAQGAEPAKAPSLVNQEAPALEVATWVAGKAATLESLRGAPVVLAFWDSGHSSSADMIAVLKQLGEKHPNTVVIAIHRAGADQVALEKLVKDEALKCAVAIDKAAPGTSPGATSAKYKAKPPSVYIIGPDGKVAFQDLAPATAEEALATLISGK
jgi:peroxiredoxin